MSGDMAPHSDETFRATLQGCNPDGDRATLIVTRQGRGQAGRIWLTFLGAITTTQEMTDEQADQLAEMLRAARGPR